MIRIISFIMLGCIILTQSPFAQQPVPCSSRAIPEYRISGGLVDTLLKPVSRDAFAKGVRQVLEMPLMDSLQKRAAFQQLFGVGNQLKKPRSSLLNVDLDGDFISETLLQLSSIPEEAWIFLLKKRENQWYLSFIQNISHHYHGVKLKVVNVDQPNKIFWLRGLMDRGSGVFLDRFYLFQYYNQRLYRVLELPAQAYRSNYSENPNFLLKTTFDGVPYSKDLMLRFEYQFALLSEEPGELEGDYVEVLNEVEPVIYHWDHQRCIYSPHFSEASSLNSEQIRSLGTFMDEVNFFRLFKPKLLQTYKSGSPNQKAVLKKYFAKYKIPLE